MDWYVTVASVEGVQVQVPAREARLWHDPEPKAPPTMRPAFTRIKRDASGSVHVIDTTGEVVS